MFLHIVPFVIAPSDMMDGRKGCRSRHLEVLQGV